MNLDKYNLEKYREFVEKLPEEVKKQLEELPEGFEEKFDEMLQIYWEWGKSNGETNE